MTSSNVGKWDRWYATLTDPAPYGASASYETGASWLSDCDLIEDWGSGKGWFSTFVPKEKYRGIDGSQTPFADVVADLAVYVSPDADGVFMRHVLEHNYQWREVLINALQSARKKIAVVLFTPTGEETKEIAYTKDVGVPDISFNLKEILDLMDQAGFNVTVQVDEDSPTQYGIETILLGVKR